MLLVGSLFVVLPMESINSALEATIQRSGSEHHIFTGKAKDIDSAVVFVALLISRVHMGHAAPLAFSHLAKPRQKR